MTPKRLFACVMLIGVGVWLVGLSASPGLSVSATGLAVGTTTRTVTLLPIRTATPTGMATATATETGVPTRPTTSETLPPTRDGSETPTATPTETATPTATATSTPRPAHLPMILRMLRAIENGGFEAGTFKPGWKTGGHLTRAVVSSTPRTGAYAALLGNPAYDSWGGCPVGEASIYQVIDVPSQGRTALHAWYRIHSYDTQQYDFFAIDISPYPIGPVERLWVDGAFYWSPGIEWTSGWREAVITLDNYRGQTIVVRLINAMTNDDGYYNTWTFVDDVSLQTAP